MITVTDPAPACIRQPVSEWLRDTAAALGAVATEIERLLVPKWTNMPADAVVRIRRAIDELHTAAARLVHSGATRPQLPGDKDPDDSARLAIAAADLADVEAERARLAVENAELRAAVQRHAEQLAELDGKRSDALARAVAAEKARDELEAKANRKIAAAEETAAHAQRKAGAVQEQADRIVALESEAAHAENLGKENRRLRTKISELEAAAPAMGSRAPAADLEPFRALASRMESQARTLKSNDASVTMRACARQLRDELAHVKGAAA